MIFTFIKYINAWVESEKLLIFLSWFLYPNQFIYVHSTLADLSPLPELISFSYTWFHYVIFIPITYRNEAIWPW